MSLLTSAQYKQGPPGANLFIFHIPNEWNDIDLFSYFESQKIGKILSVRVMTDKKEGRSRGFGFVSYETPQQALEAIKRVNGKSVLGKRLKVELKQGNSKSFPMQESGMSDKDRERYIMRAEAGGATFFNLRNLKNIANSKLLK